ncbi:MAG: CPBP family intramembrane metalloprotease [Candidatus Symbiothrix sp.]|jgi:membrane protease YdiL (CAAX protease family)|nr:CPBP family intramembrane metalloprotease [Candidatus Symbiothrix sp.]
MKIRSLLICAVVLLIPSFLYLLVTILVGPFFKDFDNTDFISYVFVIFVSSILIYRFKLYQFIKIGIPQKQLFFYVSGIIVLGVLTLFVMNNFSFQFSLNFEKHLIVRYVKIIFLAAIFEEIIFRGITFEYLESKSTNKWIILLFTSLIFGFIHLPGLFYFINAFIFAIFSGIIYLKERNLIYPIIMHSFYNLFWILF